MAKRTTHKKTQLFPVLIMLMFLVVVITAALAAILIFWVPDLAFREFGAPADGLSRYQIFVLSGRMLLYRPLLTDPLGSHEIEVRLTIAPDQDLREVAAQLERARLIPQADIFLEYMIYKGLDRTVQTGDFSLHPGMSPIQIAYALQDPLPGKITIGMVAGWRVEELIDSLIEQRIFNDRDRMLAIARDPRAFGITTRLPIDNGLEGFLAPGSYSLERDGLTPEVVFQAMVLGFENKLGVDLENRYTESNLSLREAVILASIVQREAVVVDEMPMIASVFHNRLKAGGWHMNADPTIQYALGFNPENNTWWTSPLSSADLRIDSPFNTYIHRGLPPGPICSPSREALQAVAYPAETGYFFFRAACDQSGRHVFAVTYEEHIQNACP